MRDEREEQAHDKGLQYVGLEGFVGVIANGAGLAMSTVDIVNQVGGKPANFLDIGGGANADVMAGALEVINNDPDVRSIFINIFGGITKGDEVANGIVTALGRVQIDAPIVIRLDGTNADEGRAILDRPPQRQAADAADDGRGGRDRRRPRGEGLSDDGDLRRREHQGRLPGPHREPGPLLRPAQPGVRHPGRRRHEPEEGGRPTSSGIPIFATVADAVEATGATASCIFIPAPGVRDAVIEAAEGGVEFIVAITEGVPAHDEAWFFNKLKRDFPNVQLLGPELPRHHQPRQVQHRHHRRAHRQGARRAASRRSAS